MGTWRPSPTRTDSSRGRATVWVTLREVACRHKRPWPLWLRLGRAPTRATARASEGVNSRHLRLPGEAHVESRAASELRRGLRLAETSHQASGHGRPQSSGRRLPSPLASSSPFGRCRDRGNFASELLMSDIPRVPVPPPPLTHPLPDDARLLSAEDLASGASVSLRTVREWIASGELPALRLGRCTRIRLSDWRRFLAAKSTA